MQDVATGLCGTAAPFRPRSKLTTFARWFTTADDDALVVAVPPDVAADNAATAVAHALAWQQHRELLLLLPEAAVNRVTARLAYVATPVRVWSLDDDLTPVPQRIPTVAAVVAAARAQKPRAEAQHDLGPHGSWVGDLMTSADQHWALDAAHRGSYLAWHCAGRQVLKLTRTATGVRVQAGVQYSKPDADREPYNEIVNAPLTQVERAEVEAAIAEAVANRLSGRDDTHVEHRMQAALGRSGLRELGMVRLAREYPAWRTEAATGYIDFLGLDAAGQLHVVESKIGSDDMLVFQALDYLTWVTAHAPAIRADLKWSPGDDSVVHIDFLVAPKMSSRSEPAIGPYTAGQLAALRDDVPWRIHLVADLQADIPVISSQPPGRMPSPKPGVVAAPIG